MARTMRTVFMGTAVFAIPVLEALFDLGYSVVAVVTQPDKPAGRGRFLHASPVKRVALERGIPVLQPPSLRKPEVVEQVRALALDMIVVAAYGKILPPEFLEICSKGCLNVHPSLLPRHRGPSPVATAILEGDIVTGTSIMVLDAGMDTGPLVAQSREPVAPDDTTGSLTERLFRHGARLLVEVLPGYLAGQVVPRPQPEEGVSYTQMLHKEDGRLDWHQTAEELGRRIRACTPWPGGATSWKGRQLKILEAKAVQGSSKEAPGGVIPLSDPAAPVGVMTARGVLALCWVQLEGKIPVKGAEFVRGHRDFIGATLPS